jgi:hypothetical protein
MVPAMEGDRPKCYPEKTLLTDAALAEVNTVFEGRYFGLSPDMKGHHFLYRTEQSF